MADYHTVYKGLEGETTEWDDIQRRLGNLPPKPEVWKPEAYAPEADAPRGAARVAAADGAEELSDLEDEAEFADDRFLEEYRQRRIRELQAAAARPRFGSLDEITGSDFVRCVTEASSSYPVVCLLYKAGHAGCGVLEACIAELARKHPNTRFLKSVATSCIPKYPDSNLPTLLVYTGGACRKQVVGLQPFGGARATPEQVALALAQWGAFVDGDGGEGGEDGGEGGSGAGGSGGGGASSSRQHVKGLVQKLVEQRLEEQRDESSDFDD